jgi:FAD/FMN-containing dehydrogenase
MKQIVYHDNLQVIGSDIYHCPAVSVGAGVILGQLSARGARDGWVVVGGECPTVGAAGGFLQGVSGFHRFVDGLAVDNVLEGEVVTAKAGGQIPGTFEDGDCSIPMPPLLSRERLSRPITARTQSSCGHCEEGVEAPLALSHVLQ